MFEKKFEELELPTSRLVRRRRHLGRVYEQARKVASRKHDLLKKNLSVEVMRRAGGGADHCAGRRADRREEPERVREEQGAGQEGEHTVPHSHSYRSTHSTCSCIP